MARNLQLANGSTWGIESEMAWIEKTSRKHGNGARWIRQYLKTLEMRVVGFSGKKAMPETTQLKLKAFALSLLEKRLTNQQILH